MNNPGLKLLQRCRVIFYQQTRFKIKMAWDRLRIKKDEHFCCKNKDLEVVSNLQTMVVKGVAIEVVLEQAIVHLQQTLLPETLDLIIVCLKQDL